MTHKLAFHSLILQSLAIRNASSLLVSNPSPPPRIGVISSLRYVTYDTKVVNCFKQAYITHNSLSSFRRNSRHLSPIQQSGYSLFASSPTDTMAEIIGDMEWFPTTNLLDVDCKTLSTIPSERKDDKQRTLDGVLLPRLGKDEAYVNAVQTAWREEVKERTSSTSKISSVGSNLKYECKDDNDDGTIFHGYAVRPSFDNNDSPPTTTTDDTHLLPGIIFFHTGAGPQDLFLRWKADALVCDHDIFDSTNGCIVLIADITSDERGWGWDNDKTHYGNVRKHFLTYDKESNKRSHLRKRIMAAISALECMPGVDKDNMAAMGWCLGGQVMAELGRMKYTGIRALASFHGVFDGVTDENDDNDLSTSSSQQQTQQPPSKTATSKDEVSTKAIICHGLDDPYIPRTDLQGVQSIFASNSIDCTMFEFENARHGFTNPAQAYNPNDKFQYDENAANTSWEACRSLLKDCLVVSSSTTTKKSG